MTRVNTSIDPRTSATIGNFLDNFGRGAAAAASVLHRIRRGEKVAPEQIAEVAEHLSADLNYRVVPMLRNLGEDPSAILSLLEAAGLSGSLHNCNLPQRS